MLHSTYVVGPPPRSPRWWSHILNSCITFGPLDLRQRGITAILSTGNTQNRDGDFFVTLRRIPDTSGGGHWIEGLRTDVRTELVVGDRCRPSPVYGAAGGRPPPCAQGLGDLLLPACRLPARRLLQPGTPTWRRRRRPRPCSEH